MSAEFRAEMTNLTWLILSYRYDVKQLTNFLNIEQLALVSWYWPASPSSGLVCRDEGSVPLTLVSAPPSAGGARPVCTGFSALGQEAEPRFPMREAPTRNQADWLPVLGGPPVSEIRGSPWIRPYRLCQGTWESLSWWRVAMMGMVSQSLPSWFSDRLCLGVEGL